MAVVAGKVGAGKPTTKKTLSDILNTETQKEISKIAEDGSKKEETLLEKVNNHTKESLSYQELQDIFGRGFSQNECDEMYKRFVSLQNNYPLRTEMHREALITYVKYAFKRDQAIANDDTDAVDKWGKLAAKQAQDAKINPNQLSAADLSDGISNFSKLVEAVEKAQDIIPILPKYKETPQDSVDYTIWQYVNYICRLLNKPTIKYSDLYKYLSETIEKDKKVFPFLKTPVDGRYDESGDEI